MAFTLVDIIILVVVLASALMALMRGLAREILTIFAWLAAAVVTIYLFPYLRGGARGIFNPPILADAVAIGTIFLIVLIPSLIVAAKISLRFGRDDPGVLDRSGGFVFGALRGLFIIGLIYWANVRILEPNSVPGWIEGAKLRPVVIAISNIFPQGDSDTRSKSEQKTKQTSKKPDPTKSDPGYDQKDRRNLDQLITTTSED